MERVSSMKNEKESAPPDPIRDAYRDGKRTGLAIAALATSAVAFVSMLGIEKGILAFVLAVLGLRGAKPGSPARRLSLGAILVCGVYVLTVVVVFILFREKLAELFRLRQKLG